VSLLEFAPNPEAGATVSAKMGKKDNSKAKERKAERRAMEARMNKGVANVKLANEVEDPLALLPKPFSVYNKNGLELQLETVRGPELAEETKVRLLLTLTRPHLAIRTGPSTWSRRQ